MLNPIYMWENRLLYSPPPSQQLSHLHVLLSAIDQVCISSRVHNSKSMQLLYAMPCTIWTVSPSYRNSAVNMLSCENTCSSKEAGFLPVFTQLISWARTTSPAKHIHCMLIALVGIETMHVGVTLLLLRTLDIMQPVA